MNVTLPDELVRQLEDIARHEERPLAEVIAFMLERYAPPVAEDMRYDDDAILGILDDDVTDMSTTVRETMEEYWRKKYGRPD